MKRSQLIYAWVGFAFTSLSCFPVRAAGQGDTSPGIRVLVTDPSGALISKASVSLYENNGIIQCETGRDGSCIIKPTRTGRANLIVTAAGFTEADFNDLQIDLQSSRTIPVHMKIEVAKQQVEVSDTGTTVSTNPEDNAGAIVLKGNDLDALSDDPDELQRQLLALAGPAAGPSGGQIYIDGFSGGQLPSKDSIREVRINQNPFSAEFDRIGYGRIEILTKPGSTKFNGRVMGYGNDSALDTRNPILATQPSYYNYDVRGRVDGPLSKRASHFENAAWRDLHNQNVVNAIDPANPTGTISAAVPNPRTLLTLGSRFDVSMGQSNTLTARYSFNRVTESGDGVGQLSLPEQAYRVQNFENALQVADNVIVNSHLINETRLQWRRIRNSQVSISNRPAITAQGSFVSGGNVTGTVRDNQDILEFANISTMAENNQTIRFGTRLRTYRDANSSTSGQNGNYLFSNLANYNAGKPDQFQTTVVRTPEARALLFDASVWLQDDWRWKPNVMLSAGIRYEGQNRISDHADVAPRLALAWAPGKAKSGTPKTVLRAGYGWFYSRFIVPPSGSSLVGTPYIIQAIHQNGINQTGYVVHNPSFYDPQNAVPPTTIEADPSAIPIVYSVDRHFNAALDQQLGIGVDHQIKKGISSNVTYLYTHGIHQYRSNNVSAPSFNVEDNQIEGATPAAYNYQFQSGGNYSQQQVIATVNAKLKNMSLFGSYVFNDAKSDTEGVTYFPSVASDPHLDYGRPSFGIKHRINLLGTVTLPHKISLAPMFVYYSGIPFNITVGEDLTGNNQFNARPTYGTCGAADVVETKYGCLDANPSGKREPLIPYGLGTGPSNWIFNMRISKVLGIGPRVRGSASGGSSNSSGGDVSSRGLSGGQSQPGRLDATVPRKYNLTLVGQAINVFNTVNWGTPNGVLTSPLFGKSQSLAGGPFTTQTSGNRSIFVQASFSF